MASQHHRMAAFESWANTKDRSGRTAPGRAASDARFEKQVDPEGVMSPADRAKAAEAARRAFMIRMNIKSQAAKRAKREGKS